MGLTGHPDRLVLPRILRQAWKSSLQEVKLVVRSGGESVNTRLTLVVPAFSESGSLVRGLERLLVTDTRGGALTG